MNTVRYSIVIVNADGSPHPGAQVATSWDKLHTLSSVTDGSGRVSFRIPKGYCILFVYVDRWKVQSFRNIVQDTTERYVYGRSYVS